MGGHRTPASRGVSPVIAVVVLVAITVVLAAVLGTTALDIGTSASDGVRAGADVDCDAGADEVTVTFASNQNADRLEVEVAGTTTSLTEVSERHTFSPGAGDHEVTVTAVGDGERAVIQSRTCDL